MSISLVYFSRWAFLTCHKQIEGQVHVKRHAIFLFIKNKVASPLKGQKEKCSITKKRRRLRLLFHVTNINNNV
jgi:hypothetical protein